MGYRTFKACLGDLERSGQLLRIDREVDPHLEAGAIQRRVFQAKGPALLFTRVKDTSFPMAGNVFGTMHRMRYIFRDALRRVEKLLALKADPFQGLKRPWELPALVPGLWHTLPKKVKDGAVLANRTTISKLPQLVSWPMDGGAYVTLPQVYSESISRPGLGQSNLGMYRIQLSGNDFIPDKEVGLHYQIHRGIGYHHAEAIASGKPFRVNVFVGGPPAMTLAAVMPLPEGLAEILFAGVLAGHRIPMVMREEGLPIPAEADFCITGTVDPKRQLPEGPFGDHLGYYSLAHDFPVLKVDNVFHRNQPVWPFTTVGRPPQEDTVFGSFIHELTEPLVPTVFSGVREVHAVDAAGVHPLLLAVGSERYVPYEEDRPPQELLTCAMSLLGTTQTSLSKYVIIGAREDDPKLTAHRIPDFFRHILSRVDWRRDLHFITRTTMDTLDYSGISLNQGSKLIIAATGKPRNTLGTELPSDLSLPDGYSDPRIFVPGMLVIAAQPHAQKRDSCDPAMAQLGDHLVGTTGINGFPLIVVADDSAFTTASWDNFLWVTFTRSDPATDIYGVGAFTHCKHWGSEGPIIIDARLKTYHAPPLTPDPDLEKRVDALGAPGGPLHGII